MCSSLPSVNWTESERDEIGYRVANFKAHQQLTDAGETAARRKSFRRSDVSAILSQTSAGGVGLSSAC
jgi:hypothetical protein